MTILELALAAYNVYNAIGTTGSVLGGIDLALKQFCKRTADDLFKESFVEAVKQSAPKLAYLTETRDAETVDVSKKTLAEVLASLKSLNISTLESLEERDKLRKITSLFQKCIILPGNQLPDKELEQKLLPVIEQTVVNFYSRLPLKQEAFNQILLQFLRTRSAEYKDQTKFRNLVPDLLDKIHKAQLQVQRRYSELIERTQAIKDDTDEIKRTTQANLDVSLELRSQLTDISNKLPSVSTSDVTAAKHQSDTSKRQELLEWLKQQTNTWQENLTTMKINREKLLNDLRDFASRGNGVIIGSPGVGKTYLLKEL
ncbi:hypothetical protein IH992_34410, partial [Candidatus Poribacteria bacterium]|nr:hypothetical protein [Candidatus Poribacteria bacterium]